MRGSLLWNSAWASESESWWLKESDGGSYQMTSAAMRTGIDNLRTEGCGEEDVNKLVDGLVQCREQNRKRRPAGDAA